MSLSKFVSEKRQEIFERLDKGLEPEFGSFDKVAFEEARAKSRPQMGAVRFNPDSVALEYIYPDNVANILLTVEIVSPERIVYLPVPSWVIESIWQGEVIGSYHFEQDAFQLLREFESFLSKEKNFEFFHAHRPKRKE